MTELRSVLCAATLFLTETAFAETRTFTESGSGRTIDAELVAANEESVMLKIVSGTVHVFSIDRLSAADRAYVSSWLTSHPFSTELSDEVAKAAAARGPIAPAPTPAAAQAQVTPVPTPAGGRMPVAPGSPPAAIAPANAVPSAPINFQVRWTKDRKGAKARPEDISGIANGMVGQVKENWLCHFTITNPTRTTFTNLVVDYHVRFSYDKKLQSDIVTGSCDIASLGALQSVNCDTKVFQVPGRLIQHYSSSRNSENNRVTTSASYRTIEMGEIAGVILVFRQNGTEIGRWESPGLQK